MVQKGLEPLVHDLQLSEPCAKEVQGAGPLSLLWVHVREDEKMAPLRRPSPSSRMIRHSVQQWSESAPTGQRKELPQELLPVAPKHLYL